jgi:hypothetical protein
MCQKPVSLHFEVRAIGCLLETNVHKQLITTDLTRYLLCDGKSAGEEQSGVITGSVVEENV